jgi:hypothetical protein
MEREWTCTSAAPPHANIPPNSIFVAGGRHFSHIPLQDILREPETGLELSFAVLRILMHTTRCIYCTYQHV